MGMRAGAIVSRPWSWHQPRKSRKGAIKAGEALVSDPNYEGINAASKLLWGGLNKTQVG